MKIFVDSYEYKDWHEVGHASVCLHLGGDVEFIKFLDGPGIGGALARCWDNPEIERTVACGGFAAEFHLLNNHWAEKRPDDDRDISQIVFHNAMHDRAAFWGRELLPDTAFSQDEDRTFMNHAIDKAAPIFDLYLQDMRQLVQELCGARRLEGWRIKELLRRSTGI